jgi:hypothetical protein
VLDDQVLWAGADDGPIWFSENRGKTWKRVDGSIKDKEAKLGVVAEIEPSRFAKETAYVVYDGHARDDMHPHVYKTENNGKLWKDITGNLPDFGPAYVIREDPVNKDVLYVGTEFGVYVSLTQGINWVKLQRNLPTAAVRTMAIQERDKDLVIGTFGSAIWVTDIAPFSEMTSNNLNKDAFLFKVKPVIKYKTRVSYGNTIEELNGDMFFRAENPPVGSIITYYLKTAVSGGIKLEIHNNSGALIRTITGSGEAGMHKIIWDLKDDATIKNNPMGDRSMTPSEFNYTHLVPTGDYSIVLRAGNYEQKLTLKVIPEPQESKQQAHIRK